MGENSISRVDHGAAPITGGSSARFIVLDGVRGMAALMVLILHSAFIFPSASLAVDLFFMLSGFVLAHGYGARLDNGEQRKRFVIARLIRLWPLYLLGCLIAIPPAIGMALFNWSFWNFEVLALSIVTAPFFILLPYDSFSIPLNPPGWSLCFELLANAVFLFTATRLKPTLFILALAGPLLLYGVYAYQGGPTGWYSLWGAFARGFFSFFTGVLIYRLWSNGLLPRIRVPALLILAIVAAICMYDPPKHRIYFAAVLFVVNPLLIWLGGCATASGRTARLCALSGELSYPVYVLHVPIIMIVEGLRFLMTGGVASAYVPTGATWAITIPISMALAWLLHFHWDVPFRRKLTDRFLKGRRPAPAIPSPEPDLRTAA
ncbi:acyltransferase family protein [Sphingobium rhizovicinum]|uniref:Acyltransferase family protein n=1 Tax=Sphingobium rhizovicinum TaxID=432308 RepID=A0ABV7NGT1_9SPHN